MQGAGWRDERSDHRADRSTSDGGGAAPFALDGSSVTGNTSSANLVLPGLSTTYGNDVVLVAIVTNGAAISTVTGANLTFAREPGLTPPTAGGSTCDLWYAVSGASALSSEVITIGNSGAFYNRSGICLEWNTYRSAFRCQWGNSVNKCL